jgi:hypothetical protein
MTKRMPNLVYVAGSGIEVVAATPGLRSDIILPTPTPKQASQEMHPQLLTRCPSPLATIHYVLLLKIGDLGTQGDEYERLSLPV